MGRGKDDRILPVGRYRVFPGPDASQEALETPVRVESSDPHQGGAKGVRDLLDQFGRVFGALEGKGFLSTNPPKIPLLRWPHGVRRIQTIPVRLT